MTQRVIQRVIEITEKTGITNQVGRCENLDKFLRFRKLRKFIDLIVNWEILGSMESINKQVKALQNITIDIFLKFTNFIISYNSHKSTKYIH
jgi:hypothetical protein